LPRRAPVFGLAALVGFRRIFAGAHDPRGVLSGAGLGVAFAELIRWLEEVAD
jgi:membrane-associated phospholipid phosphatase